jgi:hypothetical protein
MQMDEHSAGYFMEARALRVQYLRGLLISLWDAVFDRFRSAGQYLMRGNVDRTRDDAA